MIWWIVLGIYLIVWYKASLIQAHRMNENQERRYKYSDLDDGDKMFNLVGAAAINSIWPIWIPLYIAFNIMLKRVPPTTKELKEQIAASEERIAELERELGIE